MSILGGFLGTVYTATTLTSGIPENRGVITRFSPVLDPGNIPVRGTGEKGLYDILIGFRQPRLTLEFLPTDEVWIEDIQDGSLGIKYLILRFVGNIGLIFVNPYVNRFTLEATHGEAIRCTAEFWAAGDVTYPVGVVNFAAASPTPASWGARVGSPDSPVYRWLDSDLYIGGYPGTPITDWWSWRYEVNNNLQRLGNVATGGTRLIEGKQRDVTGLIVRDCMNFAEYWQIANLGTEMDEFNIAVTLGATNRVMLDCDYCRWGTLEAPSGPEDLIAKRFPFTATDLATFVKVPP